MGIFSVLVDAPAHSGLTQTLDYTSEQVLKPGQLVRVPLGRREVWGVVWDAAPSSALDPSVLKSVIDVCEDLPTMSAHWRQLVSFAAQYYQRNPGEVALQALPPQLRTLSKTQLQRRLNKATQTPSSPSTTPQIATPTPTPEQAQALQALDKCMEQAAKNSQLFELLQEARQTDDPIFIFLLYILIFNFCCFRCSFRLQLP